MSHARRASISRKPSWLRAWYVALLALVIAVLPLRVEAQTAGAVPETSELTEELPPGQQAPGDAPRVEAGKKLTIPPPPASFNTHDGGWIRFAYLPAVRERVQPLITDADAVRAELTERFGRPVLDKVTVYIARTPGEMATLAPEGAPFPKYAAGVAYSDIGFVLLTIHPVHPNSRHDLGEVFRHELAHVAMHDAVGGKSVPRWFNEGFAVFASGESSFPRMQTLWTATLADELLPLRRLERSFPSDAVTASVAYAEAADIVRFLLRKQERHRFSAMVDRIRKGQEFESSMKDAYGVDYTGLEYEWREDVAKRYTFWPVLFSGSVIWTGALGLFIFGLRRRKKRDKATLARWAREEALEDEMRRRIRQSEAGRVHIVLTRNAESEAPLPTIPEGEIPKVEHDGSWHTLH